MLLRAFDFQLQLLAEMFQDYSSVGMHISPSQQVV